MTRMPAPFRVPPTQAHELLKSRLRDKVTLVQLSPQDAWRLLTLNVRHFERVAPEGMDVVAATKAKL